MKIALATSWPDKCGVAEYSQNLVKSLPNVKFKIVTDLTDAGIAAASKDCDLIHLAYEPSIFKLSISGIKSWKKPTVMTYFPSNQYSNLGGITNACDKVVLLEETNDNHPKYVYIPMGIPDGEVANYVPEENMIGTIGFPFHWRGYPYIAHCAWQLGMKYLAIAPTHPWLLKNECEAEQAEIKRVYPKTELYTEWMPTEDVFKKLRRCSVILFSYRSDNPSGVASAVRYGLATGRPIILGRYKMHRDLVKYEDELYFVSQNADVPELMETIKVAKLGAKKPNRLLHDMSWSKAGKMYEALYKELTDSEK